MNSAPSAHTIGAGQKGDGISIIHPDFERRIDLPGAGPCSRPVEIDRSRTGFSSLVSLRVYSFVHGVVIDGDAEDDEVFIVLMRGEAEITVAEDGTEADAVSLGCDGGSRAVYMPPQASYRLTTATGCDIAYARVEPRGTALPKTRGFAPAGARLNIIGYATGMDLAFVTVRAGEAAAGPGGNEDSPERFLHLRAVGDMRADIAGERLDDWDTVALDDGEKAEIRVAAGVADILTISASKSRNVAVKGTTDKPL